MTATADGSRRLENQAANDYRAPASPAPGPDPDPVPNPASASALGLRLYSIPSSAIDLPRWKLIVFYPHRARLSR